MSIVQTRNDYILRINTIFGTEITEDTFQQFFSNPIQLSEIFEKLFNAQFKVHNSVTSVKERKDELQSLFLELPDAEVREFCMNNLNDLAEARENACDAVADLICCLWDEKRANERGVISNASVDALEALQLKIAQSHRENETLKEKCADYERKLSAAAALEAKLEALTQKFQSQVQEMQNIRQKMHQAEKENVEYAKHVAKQQQEIKTITIRLQELGVNKKGLEACLAAQSGEYLECKEKLQTLQKAEEERKLLEKELEALHQISETFQKGLKMFIYELFKDFSGDQQLKNDLQTKFDPAGTFQLKIDDFKQIFANFVLLDKNEILKKQNQLDFLEQNNQAMLRDLQTQKDKNEYLNNNYITLLQQYEQESAEKLRLLHDKSRFKQENAKLMEKISAVVKKKLQLLTTLQGQQQANQQLRQLVAASLADLSANKEASTKSSISSITTSLHALSEMKAQLEKIKIEKRENEEQLIKSEEMTKSLQSHIDILKTTLQGLKQKNQEIDDSNEKLIMKIQNLHLQKDEFHVWIEELKADYQRILDENGRLLSSLEMERDVKQQLLVAEGEELEELKRRFMDLSVENRRLNEALLAAQAGALKAAILEQLRHLVAAESDEGLIERTKEMINEMNQINQENELLKAQIIQLSNQIEKIAAENTWQYSNEEILSLHNFTENLLNILLQKFGQKMTTYWFYKESQRSNLINFLLRDQIIVDLQNILNEQLYIGKVENINRQIILQLEEKIYKLQELLIKEIYQRVKSQLYLTNKGMPVHVTYEDCLNLIRQNQIDENRIDEVIKDFIIQIKKQTQFTRKQKV